MTTRRHKMRSWSKHNNETEKRPNKPNAMNQGHNPVTEIKTNQLTNSLQSNIIIGKEI